MAKNTFNRSNNETHKRGVGGRKVKSIFEIVDETVPKEYKCICCGNDIPDPWYRPDNICYECKRKQI